MTVWDSAAMGISLGFEYGYRIWDYHVHHRAIPGIYNQSTIVVNRHDPLIESHSFPFNPSQISFTSMRIPFKSH